MTLTEGIIKLGISIDFESEILYGQDQTYFSTPTKFPTVEFQLNDSMTLCKIADTIRKADGHKPMFLDADEMDLNGWYNFYIGLNGFTDTKVDTHIEFVVVSEDADDNEWMYTIDLTEEEQRMIYDELDRQCKKKLGKGCEELLAEAEKEMK